jgi:predicted amidohydrolase/DNA-binding GntR family transcriptional regulator
MSPQQQVALLEVIQTGKEHQMARNSRNANQSATQVAYDWLRDTINRVPWDQELFLNEMHISQATGASRTSVREALARFEALGFIKRIPNRGAYVPALSPSDIDAMLEARQTIEEWAVAKCVETKSSAHLTELLAEQESFIHDPLRFIEADTRFHQFIVGSGSNQVLSDTYTGLRMKQTRMGIGVVASFPDRAAQVLAEHRAITQAIADGDRAAAVAAVHAHIETTRTAFAQSTLGSTDQATLLPKAIIAPPGGDQAGRQTLSLALVEVTAAASESVPDRIERVKATLLGLDSPDLIILPEVWAVGYNNFTKYRREDEPLDGSTVAMAREVAQVKGCYVAAGSFLHRNRVGAIRNTSVLISPAGGIVHQFSKVHLFSHASEEAQILTPGTAAPVARLPFANYASAICYDLRFPGLWDQLGIRGAELIVVPAAWPLRRLEHWRALTTARAIETQAFVVACNAAPDRADPSESSHSRVVAPDGRLISETTGTETILNVQIDLAEIDQIRKGLPFLQDRLVSYQSLAE